MYPKLILTLSLLALAPAAGNAQTINNVQVAYFPAFKPVTVTGDIGTLNDPGAVAVDKTGNIFIADYYNHRVVEIAANGATTAIVYNVPAAGNAAASCAFPTTTGIPGPDGIAVDSSGNVYVSDADNNIVVKLTAGNLNGGGTILATGSLCDPEGITVDASGNVYVADTYDNQVLKLTPGGILSVVTAASYPLDVAVDYSGNVYFLNFVNNSTGSSVGLASFNGTGYGSAITFISAFNEPYGLTIANNTLYVVNSLGGNVYSFPALSSLTNPPYTGTSGGAGFTISNLNGPDSLAVDGLGNIYILNGNGINSTFLDPNTLLEVPVIGYTAIPAQTVGADPILLNHYFSSNGDLSITTSSIACSVSGNFVSMITGGTCTLTASLSSGASTTVSFNVQAAASGGNQGTLTSAPGCVANGVAYDAAGLNAYTAYQCTGGNTFDGYVSRVPVAGGTATKVITGLAQPYGLALDAGGDIFVDDQSNNTIYEVPAGTALPAAINGSVDYSLVATVLVPSYLTANSVGDVLFVTEGGTTVQVFATSASLQVAHNQPRAKFVSAKWNSSAHLTEVSNSAWAIPPVTLVSGGTGVGQTALDASGNLYFVGNGSVNSIPAGTTNAPTVVFTPVTGTLSGGLAFSGGNLVVPTVVPASSSSSSPTYTVNTVTTAGSPVSSSSSSVPLTYIAAASSSSGTAILGSTGTTPGVAGNSPNTLQTTQAAASVSVTSTLGTPQTVTLSYNLASGATLGAPTAQPSSAFSVTQNSCAGLTGPAACSITVQFIPQFAGLTKGAVTVTSAGVPLTTYISGFGSGPQIVYPTSTGLAKYSGSQPLGVTTDSGGNVYYSAHADSAVSQGDIYIGGSTTPIASALTDALGIAVDGAGNVYYSADGKVYLLTPAGGGTYTKSTYATGFAPAPYAPQGLATDGIGNLYVADYANNRVVEIAAGSYNGMPLVCSLSNPSVGCSVVNTGVLPLESPEGVAVDANGNLFIANTGYSQIVEVPASGVAASIVATGFQSPSSVAVDAAGNLYVTDSLINQVYEVRVGANTPTAIPVTVSPALSAPYSIAVDGGGNLWIADSNNNRIVELAQSSASLSFGSVAVSSSASKTLNVANIGNAAASSFGVGFTAPFAATGCSSITPGATCQASLTFTPTAVGAASETAGGLTLTGTGTLATQTITFGTIGAQTVGTPLTLSATASSGLAVSFVSNTSSVCTVSGTTAKFVAAGTCSLTASQAGNSVYAAATPVTQTFTVNPAPQTITFGTIAAQTVGTPLTLSATASSGLAVSFASNTTGVCTVSGTTATFIAAGTCSLTASQAGNTVYAAATPVTQSFTVNPSLKPQTITFNVPVTQTVGTPLTLIATTTSGLTVSFASGTPNVCTVSGTTATFSAAGTCSITASQAGNTMYAAATPVTRSFTVNAAPLKAQTITFNAPATQAVGTPLALSATASSTLTVSFASTTPSVCTVSGTTATFIAAGTCSITASQAGNAVYAAATPVTRSFTVNPAPTITSAQVINVAANGTATSIAVKGANLSGTFGAAVTTPTGSAITIKAGTVTATSVPFTVTVPAGTAAGNYTVTISNGTTPIGTFTLVVNAPVNLASYFNVDGISKDGTVPLNKGFDNDGYAYSATLLGTSATFNSLPFTIAAPGGLDAVDGVTITLPQGNFSSINLLAAGVNGSQTNQAFVVTYTDGTTTTFTQSLSDWVTPKSFSGETRVVSMSYRVTPTGGKQTTNTYVYGYTFTLNSAKTVKSIKLPDNRNVVVLAITL